MHDMPGMEHDAAVDIALRTLHQCRRLCTNKVRDSARYNERHAAHVSRAIRVSVLFGFPLHLLPSFLPHRSERRGERVAGVDDFPLQGRVDGTDEQLQSRFVEVVGKVLLFRDQ